MTKKILYLGLDPTFYQAQGEITHWPIIQIVPRPKTDDFVSKALKQFDLFSHVIITSKSTITILKEYLPYFNFDLKDWRNKGTFAIGQTTAKHLEAHDIRPISVAEEETAEGMVEVLKKFISSVTHVFWPHSSEARMVIKNFLITQKIPYTACSLYEPQLHQRQPLPNLTQFDEIVFTSPSTVRAFLTIFGTFPKGICLVSLGPITAQFLAEKNILLPLPEKKVVFLPN